MEPEPAPHQAPTPSPEAAELQFERAAPANDQTRQDTTAGVACSLCKQQIHASYFALGTDPVCSNCKEAIEATERRSARWPVFFAALGAGFVAAVLGAALYYAVIAITNFEIGLVAIAIGFMVGWAIRKVTKGFGRRRYQVIGVLLTWLSVGMAYMPLAFKGLMDDKPSTTATDSTSTLSTAPATDSIAAAATPRLAPADSSSETTDTLSGRSLGLGLGIAAILGLSLALPVMAIAGSMPSGLISALIILFGMQQAWRMTGRPALTITGPYTVGSAPPQA
jgi:FtsH-binding integral membrane protein